MNQNLCMVQYRKCMSIICFLKIIKKKVMDCLNTKEHKHHVTRMSKKHQSIIHFSCHRTQTTDTNLERDLSNEKKIMGNYNLKKKICVHIVQTKACQI